MEGPTRVPNIPLFLLKILKEAEKLQVPFLIENNVITKSNLILGMGETREEVTQALVDLRGAGCDLITITQYLRPTAKHHPVVRWVKPNEFVELSKEAEEIGFLGVMSGPLVRSSYRAGRLYNQAMAARAVK